MRKAEEMLFGEVVNYVIHALRENLIGHSDAERSRIIIDFTNADNISGDGIGLLCSIQQRVVK